MQNFDRDWGFWWQYKSKLLLLFFMAITHFKFTETSNLLREHVSYACSLVSSKVLTNNFMPNSNANVDVNGDNRVSRFSRKQSHLTLSQCDLNNSPCTQYPCWRRVKPELQLLWKCNVSFSFIIIRMDKSSNNRPFIFPLTTVFHSLLLTFSLQMHLQHFCVFARNN